MCSCRWWLIRENFLSQNPCQKSYFSLIRERNVKRSIRENTFSLTRCLLKTNVPTALLSSKFPKDSRCLRFVWTFWRYSQYQNYIAANAVGWIKVALPNKDLDANRPRWFSCEQTHVNYAGHWIRRGPLTLWRRSFRHNGHSNKTRLSPPFRAQWCGNCIEHTSELTLELRTQNCQSNVLFRPWSLENFCRIYFRRFRRYP